MPVYWIFPNNLFWAPAHYKSICLLPGSKVNVFICFINPPLILTLNMQTLLVLMYIYVMSCCCTTSYSKSNLTSTAWTYKYPPKHTFKIKSGSQVVVFFYSFGSHKSVALQNKGEQQSEGEQASVFTWFISSLLGSWMHARSFTYSNENRVLTGHSASLEVKILNYDDLHKTLD